MSQLSVKVKVTMTVIWQGEGHDVTIICEDEGHDVTIIWQGEGHEKVGHNIVINSV